MRTRFFLTLLITFAASLSAFESNAQCTPRSNSYWGEMVPNAGCGIFASYAPFGPGQYFRMPVLAGGSYSISTCGAPINTQITLFQNGNTVTPIGFNDDNGPSCGGANASIDIVPAFSDYVHADVRQFNCAPGGTSSITVQVRQNNNLTITSSAADMCEGDTRALTATPAPVGGAQANSGNLGTFTGTGVAGTTFTAPTPAGASGTYTITYLFGYCQATQVITVFRNPSVANAGPDQTLCSTTTATLAGNTPTYGSGNWTIVSGPGTISVPTSPSSSVTGLVPGSTTVLQWTITNGPCAATMDQVSITIDQNPTTANAGTDIQSCVNPGTATLAGNAPAVGTGMWTLVAGAGTITTPTSPTSGITGLGAGANTFRWTISNGVCPDSFDDVIITGNPPPSVSFTPLADLCENDAIYTLVEGSPGGGTYTGAGVSGGNFNPASAGTGAHTLTYTYVDGFGCSNFATQNINVLGAPAVVANGGAVLCEGQSTTISATGANSYTWDQGVGAGPSHVVTPSVTTTYTVTGVAVNGCSNTDNTTITVNALPTVTLGALPAQCTVGGPYTFVEGSPAGGTYSGPGVAGGQITPGTAGVGNHWIYYQYTDGNTCTNIDSNTIEIYTSPTVVANASVTELCVGDPLTLTGSGAVTYSWNLGVTDGVTFTPATGVYNYIVTGSDANACSNVDSVLVTVHGLPTVVADPDQTVCEGTSVTLSGTGADTYTWDNGVSNGVSFIPPVGVTNYVVTGVDANSCENTDTTSITVNPNPVLVVSPDQIFCLGDSVALSASGADSYDWDSGTSIVSTYTLYPTQTTTVDLVGTSIAGCTTNASVVLTLDDPTNLTVSDDEVICQGFTANLMASGGVDYLWNGPGYTDENTDAISFTVDTTAYYYVSITTALGCVYVDSVFITASTDPSCTIEILSSITPNDDGINDTWRILGIELFPENTVTIVNRWGDVVFQQSGYDNDLIVWDGTYNGQKLGAGTYFYVVEIVNGPSHSGWIQLMK